MEIVAMAPCYSWIQVAIANAATGSVILVKQGTYADSLSLDGPVKSQNRQNRRQ